MPTVTVFRGHSGHRFHGAEKIGDFELPVVPRVGETLSLGDHEHADFEEVLGVNYRAGDGGIAAEVVVRKGVSHTMQTAPIGGI